MYVCHHTSACLYACIHTIGARLYTIVYNTATPSLTTTSGKPRRRAVYRSDPPQTTIDPTIQPKMAQYPV